MNYIEINRLCTNFIKIIVIGILFAGFMLVSGGIVLNDLERALVEIEDLERKHLLDNPPETISDTAKTELRILKNSEDLKKYIKENEDRVREIAYSLYIMLYTFLIIIFIKVLLYIKIKMDK